MSVHPMEYGDTALVDKEAAKKSYKEAVRNGRNHSVPDFQEYIRDMNNAADIENQCEKWTEGSFYLADEKSNFCLHFSLCKALITFLKFLFTMAAIVLISKDTSYFNKSSKSSSSSSNSYYYGIKLNFKENNLL